MSEAAVEVFFPPGIDLAGFEQALRNQNPGATVRCAHHELSDPDENRHVLGIVSGVLDMDRACVDNAKLVLRLVGNRFGVIFTNPAATKRCELCSS